ncbi:MAG: metallophosphoesterase [Bacteroidales bacterium]|nr:metallophosphoesterase [Bacteroidales bacterium]
MSNWIIIPDVHGRKFWRAAVQGHEEDKIIFLGDYVDPYDWEGISASEAFKELQDIIAFKKEHPDNVVLLLGNPQFRKLPKVFA